MRKVIFTESQLKKILGENFDTYLPKKDYAEENPNNAYGTQVSLTGKDSKGDPIDTVATDRIAKSRTPSIGRFRRISENDELNEENQELVNHEYNLGMKMNGQIDTMAAQNPNDKLLQNMSNDKNMKHGTAKKRKHDLEVMKDEDPVRFQSINGNNILSGINRKLKNDTDASKSHKEFKKNVLGYSNAFQKEGGRKNASGTAHTNNNITVTYEN